MRRRFLLFIPLMLLVIIVGTGCETLTPPPSVKSPTSSSLVLSQQNTGIWVTGEGSVMVIPDVANLSLGVEVQAATVAEARSQATSVMDTVISKLGAQGVADKDIKTRHFSIYPVRKWIEEREEEIIIGYRVANTVSAKVIKVEDTGTIIDAVAGAGGDYIRINNISFTIDDPTAYQKEAREKAMADAEEKAKQLADYGGVKLGEPIYINESGGSIPIVRVPFAEARTVSAPAPVTPISPGETEIRLTVQVAYSIR